MQTMLRALLSRKQLQQAPTGTGGQLAKLSPASRKWTALQAAEQSAREAGLSVAREAALLQAATVVGNARNRALVEAADRLAVVAGGGVAVAATALAKAHDYAGDTFPLDLRVWHMQQWATSKEGRRFLERGRQRLRLLQSCSGGVLAEAVLCQRFASSSASLKIAECRSVCLAHIGAFGIL